MFYNNSLKLKNIPYKKYNYASFTGGINTDYDENLLPIRYSKNTYNFSYNNGSLTKGLGIDDVALSYRLNNKNLKKTLNLPEGVDILGAWIFTKYSEYASVYDDYLLLYCSDQHLYANFMYISSPSFFKVQGMQFSTCPKIINYYLNGEDVILVVGKEEGMYVWSAVAAPYKVENAPPITSMCVHYERLFATVDGDKRSVWFSDDLDPTNWNLSLNEGGFINLMDDRGTSNKVISFNDYVYVFREFGIDRITAYASQENFSITQLFTSSNRIYTNTICVCGDRIMFLASDGIYTFNGISTSKINFNIDKILTNVYNDNAIGAFFDGHYYLACTLNFNDGKQIGGESADCKNNALLEIDIKTGELNILRGADIVNMQTINNLVENVLLVCVKVGQEVKLGKISRSGAIFGVPTEKMWASPSSTFGDSNREKIIKSLSLKSKTDIELVFHTEKECKKVIVKGGKDISTIRPNIKGRRIAIDFICKEQDANISNPQVVVGFL